MMNSEMSSASYQTAAGAHPSSKHARHPQHPHAHGAVHPQQMMYQQQQQMNVNGQQMHHQQQMPMQPPLGNGSGMPMGGGGTLYTNLIPGHYRYGAKPPAPPPGPLSYSNTSSSSRPRQQPQMHSANGVQDGIPLEQSYQNIPPASTSPTRSQGSQRNFLQVSEPDDDDDEFFDVVSLDLEDDETHYRPFKHAGSGGESPGKSKKKGGHKSGKGKARNAHTATEEAKPVDLLSVLLGGSALQQQTHNTTEEGMSDVAILMGEASVRSQKARSLTDALAAKQHKGEKKAEGGDNDLYAATSNAHAEAAVSFQQVYRMLLGLEGNDGNGNNNSDIVRPKAAGEALAPSEELAKSMLVLANAHARMAKSLGSMGEKWNMGKVDSGGRMMTKNASAATDAMAVANGKSKGKDSGKKASKAKASESTPGKSSSSNAAGSSPDTLQHERLRMAVRGALDTANHEEDITNSTFLARSTLTSNKNARTSRGKSTKNKLAGMMGSKRKNVEQGVNPVDDLMKLEKELQSMDMALEMENSVASLGTATTTTRPDGSFMVVPKGSSYLSSSSMWSHQQHAKPPHHGRLPQKGAAGVRSRTNHLQNFAGKTAPSPPRQKQGLQITPGNPGALDQSWWGGGQGSILANAAATATSNNQRPPPNSAETNNPNATSSTGTKQLMQLMDSLKRLGDENAQLMREVEDAKAARAEAKAAKDLVAKFKTEYSQRFNKVKEALGKYSSPNAENPVAKSAYMKSVSATEIKKRDEMIKQLSGDLKKERDECKRKEDSLKKYEAFYREVKARSAEKAKQRAEQERKKAEEQQRRLQLQQQKQQQQQRP
ncbi:hypothetical protein ACHAXT_004182 [Thalassiosira profunda]